MFLSLILGITPFKALYEEGIISGNWRSGSEESFRRL